MTITLVLLQAFDGLAESSANQAEVQVVLSSALSILPMEDAVLVGDRGEVSAEPPHVKVWALAEVRVGPHGVEVPRLDILGHGGFQGFLFFAHVSLQRVGGWGWERDL